MKRKTDGVKCTGSDGENIGPPPIPQRREGEREIDTRINATKVKIERQTIDKFSMCKSHRK